MKLYKVLDHYQSCTAGSFDWTTYLPYYGPSGKWTPIVKNPLICERGYHGTDPQHLILFIHGNQLFEVEAKGIIWDEDGEKFTSQSMRLVQQIPEWNDRTLRLFAVWSSREILKYMYDPDPRSINACDVAERYANGQASEAELEEARNLVWNSPKDIAWNISRAVLRIPAWIAARDTIWNLVGYDAYKLSKIKLLEMVGLRQVIP